MPTKLSPRSSSISAPAIAATVATDDSLAYAYLADYATKFRQEHGITAHRRMHCQAAAYKAFRDLRNALKLFPGRQRTKSCMAKLVSRYMEVQAEYASELTAPLDVIAAQLQEALVVEPQFQTFVLRSAQSQG